MATICFQQEIVWQINKKKCGHAKCDGEHRKQYFA